MCGQKFLKTLVDANKRYNGYCLPRPSHQASVAGRCKNSPHHRGLDPRTESICKTFRVSLFVIQTLRFN
jgi:hypothetical protein